jgi:hypothetical protein
LVQNPKQEETRVLTELSDMELALVAGGQGTPTPPPLAPTGNLSKATLLKALRVIQGVTILLPNPDSGYVLPQNLFG